MERTEFTIAYPAFDPSAPFEPLRRFEIELQADPRSVTPDQRIASALERIADALERREKDRGQ